MKTNISKYVFIYKSPGFKQQNLIQMLEAVHLHNNTVGMGTVVYEIEHNPRSNDLVPVVEVDRDWNAIVSEMNKVVAAD